MPDPAPSKRKQPALHILRSGPARGYAELHARSNFSFLEGASHPDELVHQAAELNYAALAVTDRNSLAGVVRAHVAAREVGLPLLIGAEITPVDAATVVLLATDRESYGRLARLITCGRRRAEKGSCFLTFDDVADHAVGLLAAVTLARPGSAEPAVRVNPDSGQVVSAPANLLTSSEFDLPLELSRYRELFGDRCYALAELYRGPDDACRLEAWLKLSRQTGVPLAAAGDVHYHAPHRQALHDALTAVRHGTTVAEAAELLLANRERHLRSVAELAEQFASAPELLERTLEVVGRCCFSLDELRYEYPEELAPPGMTPLAHLEQLTWEGARRQYPDGIPDKVRSLVEHELELIEQLRYEAYFLTVWDLVRFARSRGILCQGRGSAANSAVCYCLGVTSVDPSRIDVLFERFVSRERDEAPDIDVDFEHERREEVLQYLYEKYGRERAGMTAEVISYRPRSAVRDVGKALGLSLERVDALAKSLDHYHSSSEELSLRLTEGGLDPHSSVARQLVALVGELLDFPRHLSQHVGGMVITQGPLCEMVPIENASMPGRTVIQWDKDDLDALGLLKVDCLALGMLTAIGKCFGLIEGQTGRRLTLDSIPAEDARVYQMVSRADTVGVFQIESRAQMSMLPRLRPHCFYDLVVEVAIVRPGPIQGNMVHPYLRRRAGLEPVEYPNEAIREVLQKTLGVPIFQEQAMRLAVVAAGFSPGEADQLRRAMGAWRKTGVIEKFRQRLFAGMQARGLSAEFAENVYRQMQGFGEYGFPESHAASFALLVYISAWLKCYYPAAFTASLLNSQPMGFYAPAQLVRDARQHGVQVLPPDVNHSSYDCTLEAAAREDGDDVTSDTTKARCDAALRLGFRQIRGISQGQMEQLVVARGNRPFRSVAELALRSALPQTTLVRLAKADAFASLGLDRRQALWHALQEDGQDDLPLFAALECAEPAAELPALAAGEQIVADYQSVGLSLKGHPLGLVRGVLDELRVLPAARLATTDNGRHVRVAGLVLMRQRPSTAKGITFVTLEDETGIANLVVDQRVWQRFHTAARHARVLLVHGRLERRGEVIHIKAAKLEDLSSLLSEVRSRSRDFR